MKKIEINQVGHSKKVAGVPILMRFFIGGIY